MPALLAVLLGGITITTAIGMVLNKMVFSNIALNYMLMGVAFSADNGAGTKRFCPYRFVPVLLIII